MKEIYLLNKGDSVDKIKYEYGLSHELKISDKKVFNYNYVDLSEGLDDVMIVRNYLPNYEYRVKKNETLMDLLSIGYKVENTRDLSEGDIVILSKPKSIRYVTRPLEKLSDIARKFGITEKYIMETNNLNGDKLFVGQILWI